MVINYTRKVINSTLTYVINIIANIYISGHTYPYLVATLATLKKCPYCKGMHRKKSQAIKCKKRHKIETWRV